MVLQIMEIKLENLYTGFTRSYKQDFKNGDRIEWLKPIMFSGIGNIYNDNINKKSQKKTHYN